MSEQISELERAFLKLMIERSKVVTRKPIIKIIDDFIDGCRERGAPFEDIVRALPGHLMSIARSIQVDAEAIQILLDNERK